MTRLRHLAQSVSGTLALLTALAWAVTRPRHDSGAPERAFPPENLPPGRVLAVPGRGEFFLREAPGPPGAGPAPVVVLLHGWMYASDSTWFTCYEALAGRARVLALDLRGHGRGPRASRPFRLVDAADDIAAVLRHLGVPRVVVVGYSMGGPVAQLLWRRHPELVAGLVLCATAATFSATVRDRLVWRAMGVLQMVLRLVPRHWWQRMVIAQAQGRSLVEVTRMIDSSAPRFVLDSIPWLVSELDRGSAEDIAEAGREMGRYDARRWLSDIDVPTAVIITARDRLISPGRQRELAAAIPRAVVFEVALDHGAVVAGPREFVPLLLAAIDRVVTACDGASA